MRYSRHLKTTSTIGRLDFRFQPRELLDAISKLCRSSQLVGDWAHTDTPKHSMYQDQCRALLPATSTENDSREEGLQQSVTRRVFRRSGEQSSQND